jgi:mRNA interferase RelE/StbE
MPYTLLTTPEFEKEYSKLSPEVAGRIKEKLGFLASHPDLLRFPLKGLPDSLKGLHKYRIGDYRVLLWPDHEQHQIILYAVAHRSEIYRRLGRD